MIQHTDQSISTNTLFVWNLPWELRGKELKDIFWKSSNVKYARVILNKEDKSKSEWYWFVEFESIPDAEKAKGELDEAKINWREIKIYYAKPRDQLHKEKEAEAKAQ